MAKMLLLRWKPVNTGNGIWFDSNLVILNGTSGVHIEVNGNGCDVTAFQSMIGTNMVTCFQDYFGGLWDKIIPHPGFGQTMKFRINKLPKYAVMLGNIEDGGDVDPENPDIPMNAFCGSEGEPFRGSDSEFFLGKQPTVINP